MASTPYSVCFGAALLAGALFPGCAGKSHREGVGGTARSPAAGSSAGGDLGEGGGSAAGRDGGAGKPSSGDAQAGFGGSVDAKGNCPAGLSYFMTIRGDLPDRTLTLACDDSTKCASVPVYDDGNAGLDPGDGELQALLACQDSERLEVWRMAPFPMGLSTAGFYRAADGSVYSTCGTSRKVKDTESCEPVGNLTLSASSDAEDVLEGSYTMTLFDAAGARYDVKGEYRVCAYNQGLTL
jgi:hypothetical protein